MENYKEKNLQLHRPIELIGILKNNLISVEVLVSRFSENWVEYKFILDDSKVLHMGD